MSFDPTKPVQTRDGRKARILATDLRSDTGETIVAVWMDSDGLEEVGSFHSDGAYLSDGRASGEDLLNITERRVLRYRVALMRVDNIEFLSFAESHTIADSLSVHGDFVRWLGDWREVEVKP